MDWTTWKPATCLPDCWCEAARTGSWILEPVNSWTNLLFITAGFIFLIAAKKFLFQKNELTSDLLFPRLYGFALVFVGTGSFFYHASETFVGQWFDVFGMYLVSVFFISYNFYRIKMLDKIRFLVFYFGSCLLLGIIIYFLPETRRWLFGISIICAFIQSLIVQKRRQNKIESKYLFSAVACYVVAQVVWLLDKNKIICDPYAWMNGHGIWHLLTGTSAILAYFYFASEENNR